MAQIERNFIMNLETFFNEHPSVAIAFSGGCDSSYLLYQASQYATDVHAYYMNTAFQPLLNWKMHKDFVRSITFRSPFCH